MKLSPYVMGGAAGAFVLFAAPAGLAARTPSAILQADDGLFAGIGYDMAASQASAATVPVDTEEGGLTAYSVGLMHIGRRSGDLYEELRLSGLFGTLGYQGNGALGLPAQGAVTKRALAAGARLGLVLDGLWGENRAVVLIPYLGAGFDRGVSGGPSGANPGGETVTTARLGIGLGLDYTLDPRLVLTLHALTGYTLGAQVTTTDPVFYDTATGTLTSARITEPLGDSPYTVLGVTIHYRVDRDLTLSLGARRVTGSASGAAPIPIIDSAGQTVGTTPIPGRRTTDTVVMLKASVPF